ncbi:MAG: peptidylprolyl isomerase, partial [Deltaproteobacteria bacterium]
MAKVGREVVTKNDFVEAINRLHTSNRVGKGLSEGESFVKQDYKKFLNELIELKLFKIEAENMGFDKEPGYVSAMDNYILNMNLKWLRQEEVVNKVEVTDKEIEEYYRDSLAKKKEEKEKAEKEAVAKEKAKAPEDKPATAQEGKKEGDEQVSGKEDDKISPKEHARIKDVIYAKKTVDRQTEFFAGLRSKASIKIDGEALKNVAEDKPETFEKAVAEVNGKAIFGREIMAVKAGKKAVDAEEARKQALEQLILHKLLDQEAAKMDYASSPENSVKVKSFSEKLLVSEFRRKVIAASVKVEESEIKEHYENKKESFRESDAVDVGIIIVPKKENAEEVLDEIKKGADFSYLASIKSIDPSSKSGGQVGRVNIHSFPEDVRKSLQAAKGGDILGPVELGGAWAVISFRGLVKGEYMPYEA